MPGRPRTCVAAGDTMHGRRRVLRLATLLAPLALWPAGHAAAQWRPGEAANPAPIRETRAGKLAGYAGLVDEAANRLHAAMVALALLGTRLPQEGSVPPAQQKLVDEAQTAWLMIKNTPEDFSDRDVYIETEQQFAESTLAMQRAFTSPAEAVAEARKILAAMRRLEQAAIELAAAAGG